MLSARTIKNARWRAIQLLPFKFEWTWLEFGPENESSASPKETECRDLLEKKLYVASIFTKVIMILRCSGQQKCGTTGRKVHGYSLLSKYRVEISSETHLPVKPLKE